MSSSPGAELIHDGYGSLDREPPRPKRAIAVQMRRALVTYGNRCAREVTWRNRITKMIADRSETADEAAKTRLDRQIASARASLQLAEKGRSYTAKRINTLGTALKERTLSNKSTLAAFGGEKFAHLAAIYEDAMDVAIVRAGDGEIELPDRNEALGRLVCRNARRMAKLVKAAIGRGMPKEEAERRRDAGIFQTTRKWDWQHASAAKFPSKAFWNVKRELEQRARSDHGVYSLRNKEGFWVEGAVSTDAIAEGGTREKDADGRFEPYSENITTTGGTLQRASQASRDAGYVSALVGDLKDAFAQLASDEDRQIAVAIFAEKRPVTQVAAALGKTTAWLRVKIAGITRLLRAELADYRLPGEEDDL